MLSENDLEAHAWRLAEREPAFRLILDRLGRPPLWERPAGFATLVWIILEQQVSLASARAAYDRLLLIRPQLTPENFLTLTDQELRKAGFSRQKTTYTRHLANAIAAGELDLEGLHQQGDDEIRQALIRLKGIGPWTADIYLLLVLRRPDIWPIHDRALVVAIRRIWQLDQVPTPQQVERMGVAWQPYRSTAARLLWHFYLNTTAASSWPRPEPAANFTT